MVRDPKDIKKIEELNAEKSKDRTTINSYIFQIRDLREQLKLIKVQQQEEKEELMKEISNKNLEIEELNKQIVEISNASNVDQILLTELTKLKTEKEALDVKLFQTNSKFAEVFAGKFLLERRVRRYEDHIKDIEELYKSLLDEKAELESKIKEMENKIQAAFKAEDMSLYLLKTINAFNTQAKEAESQVTYIINKMDFDLKTLVANDEESKVLFTAPSLSETRSEALSNIKFSITAVPKDMAADD